MVDEDEDARSGGEKSSGGRARQDFPSGSTTYLLDFVDEIEEDFLLGVLFFTEGIDWACVCGELRSESGLASARKRNRVSKAVVGG